MLALGRQASALVIAVHIRWVVDQLQLSACDCQFRELLGT